MARESRLELTERDQLVLQLCHDYIYVDSNYLKEWIFIFPEATEEKVNSIVNLRLKKLVDHGYLERFLRVTTTYAQRDTVYTLGQKGEEFMLMMHGYCDYKGAWRSSLKIWYNHALSILRITEGLRRQLADHPVYTVVEFIPEVRAFFQYGEGKKDVIRPDGLIVIGGREDKRNNICLFLEAENSIATYRAFKEKMSRYEALLSSGYKVKNYEDHVVFEEPIGYYIPLFVASDRIRPELIVEKLMRYKEETATNPNSIYQSQSVLVTSQSALSTDCFGEVFTNVSLEDPATKIKLLNQ